MILKTSMIIITRNREKILARCLESLVKQTLKPDEIVIIDNASSDNTNKVIQTFKEKLPINYIFEKQIGIPYARNKGLQHTTGELILMLDDDCVADRYWVENMVKAHEKYHKAWAIQGRTFSIPPKNIYSMIAEFDRSIFMLSYTKKKLPLRNFLKKNFRFEIEILTCDTNNFSVKASYIKKYKLSFDERFDNHAEDTDFGKQIVEKKGIIIFSSEINVFHRERTNFIQFIEQHWHFGRAAARITDKWKTPSLITKIILGHEKLLSFFIFCKSLNQLVKSPLLLSLLFADRISYLNGYFFEKINLFLEKHT